MAAGSSNPTTNLKKVAGTAVAVNTGNASNGTQRVVLATDQPSVAVTASLAASQTLSTVTSVGTVTNLNQLGGANIAMNTGTRSAGTQRVTIATDDIVPASQSGTWTVQPGNTQNTVPWYSVSNPNVLPAPSISGITYPVSGIGGTIANGTYYLKVVGVDAFGNTTLPGTEYTLTLTGPTAIRLSITNPVDPGIDHYRLYVSGTSNGQSSAFIRLDSSVNNVITSFSSTGTAAIPVTATAYGARNKELVTVTDPNNSTTSNLAPGSTFIGVMTDISEFAEISVSVNCDRPSQADGLVIQFSQDGTNFNTNISETYTNGNEATYRTPTRQRYMRVLFAVNTIVNTSFLRLQTRLHRTSANGTLRSITTSVDSEDFAQQTRSILNGRNTPASSTFSDVVVKPASTAALATDTALVVTVSPNNSVAVTQSTASNLKVEAALAASQTLSTVTTVTTVTNLSQLGGANIAMGTGARSAGTQRVTIATDDVVPASQSGTWNVGLNTGSNTIGNVGIVAGTNTIGKVDLNAGTNTIGKVELVAGSATIGTVGISFSKAEDVAAADGDALLPIAAVREDTLSANTNATGDYTYLKTTSVGRLWTSAVIDSSLPTGSNTIGNVVLAAGTNAIGKLTANAGVNIGDVAVSNTVTVSGTVSINAIPTGSNTIGNVGIVAGSATIGKVEVVAPTSAVLTNSNSAGLVSSLVIKASAGNLYMLNGYNNAAGSQFIQIHNTASVPGNGSVPILTFAVPANSNFSFDWGVYGRRFSTGITVTNSSTAGTLTIGANNCWFDAQYA